MAITESEIQYRLTGGAANSDPNASLGGAISNTAVDLETTLHNLFDKVSGAESAAGAVEYRCIGVRNGNASLTLEAARVWIASQVASGATIAIGVETPVSGSVQTIANETTAPTAVSFSAPADYANGLVLTSEGNAAGEIAAGEWVAVWIRRTVPAATSALDNDGATLQVQGDTPQ